MARKVILIVIDALSSWVVRPALDQGKLPTLRRLANEGRVEWDCTSIFPSLTPAATASICTGRYPADHGVSGAYFFDRVRDKVHFFGEDMWTILNKRLGNYFDDFLRSLNHELLASETIFETLEDHGLTCASLNFLIFRGRHSHKATTPWSLRLLPGVPHAVELKGPETFCLGDFVSGRRDRPQQLRFRAPGGMFHRYGFTDATASAQLKALVQQGLPDFTLAYFPDNDFDSHQKGPEEALETLQAVDRELAAVAELAGGLDGLLNEAVVLITGDHSQSPLEGDAVGIDLERTLDDFRLVSAGCSWGNGDELMVCPNLRAAQLYLRPEYQIQQSKIIQRILTEPRVDQVIARQDHDDDGQRFVVATADRGRLEFWPSTPDEADARDDFGGHWRLGGDLTAVDARISAEGKLVFGDYPNALERLTTAFDRRHTGDMWVTARLGHEFCQKGGGVNKRGSHGSLHRQDSTVPLFVAGDAPWDLLKGNTDRTVDIAPLCLALLDAGPKFSSSRSHAAAPPQLAESPVNR